MIYEMGYGFTGSVEECRNTLMQFGAQELTPVSVARVLGMMAHHHTGLTDGISVQVSKILSVAFAVFTSVFKQSQVINVKKRYFDSCQTFQVSCWNVILEVYKICKQND